MKSVAKFVTAPKFRKWAYGVTTAGLTVLGVYGIVTADQVAAWAFLAAAVTGMATANTDTSTPNSRPAKKAKAAK